MFINLKSNEPVGMKPSYTPLQKYSIKGPHGSHSYFYMLDIYTTVIVFTWLVVPLPVLLMA